MLGLAGTIKDKLCERQVMNTKVKVCVNISNRLSVLGSGCSYGRCSRALEDYSSVHSHVKLTQMPLTQTLFHYSKLMKCKNITVCYQTKERGVCCVCRDSYTGHLIIDRCCPWPLIIGCFMSFLSTFYPPCLLFHWSSLLFFLSLKSIFLQSSSTSNIKAPDQT